MKQSRQIEAVIFDWAGTIIDFGSLAPMGAFVKVFSEFGISISVQDARVPMGMAKLDHIRAIGAMPHVASQWRTVHGGGFDDAAANAVYEKFLPLNIEVVADYADLIDGTVRLTDDLRAKGVRIGTTTGYTRSIMERVTPLAAEQGFVADSMVCAGDLWAGRPTPAMMWKSFLELQLVDPTKVIKVDDTPVGIAEGIAAGTWTVGVVASGNEMGLSKAEWNALSPKEQQLALDQSSKRLLAAGSHFVIPSVAGLPSIIEIIEQRLASGMHP